MMLVALTLVIQYAIAPAGGRAVKAWEPHLEHPNDDAKPPGGPITLRWPCTVRLEAASRA